MAYITENSARAKRCGKRLTQLIEQSLLECPKEDLARILGKEVGHIQKIEKGQVPLEIDDVVLAANFFQKDPGYLIN